MRYLFSFLLLFLVLFVSPNKSYCQELVLCFNYSNVKFTRETCRLVKIVAEHIYGSDLVFIESDMSGLMTLDNNFDERINIIYICGFGIPDGFFLNASGDRIISWKQLARILKGKSDILIIDSCYSGRIFETGIDLDIPMVITSTNDQSMSVNVPFHLDIFNSYVSTISYALYCIFVNDEYCQQNFIHCGPIFIDPQLCQFEIIMMQNNFSKATYESLYQYKHYHPNISIGTLMLNGCAWRHLW